LFDSENVAAVSAVAGDVVDAAGGDGSAAVATAAGCGAVAGADAAAGLGSSSDSPDDAGPGPPSTQNGCYRRSLPRCEKRDWCSPFCLSFRRHSPLQVSLPEAASISKNQGD